MAEDTQTNRYKDLATWKAFVADCKTEDDLNYMARQLRAGQHFVGVHPFVQTNQYGLAQWLLTQRAEKLGGYKLNSNNTYIIPKTK